jgi:phage terminase small subunit
VTEIANTKEGVKIKIGDKRAALADLAKILGFTVDKVEHGGKIETAGPDVSSMTPEQLAKYEAFLIAMSATK